MPVGVAEGISLRHLKLFLMSLNFPKWMNKYENANLNKSIKYRGSSGAWKEDKYYRFYAISSELQQRGRIYRDELRNIGEWKTNSDGRIDSFLKENNQIFVERRSAVAFQTSNDEKKIEELTELTGAKVPLASTILTMYDPANYAVVDNRTFRALGAAEPRLLDSQMYPDYAEFIEHLQNYNSAPKAYSFYIDVIRQIAQREGILPREVDMALWAYDKHSA